MPAIKRQNAIQKALWGSYKPTDLDMEAVSFCLNRGIHVSLLGVKNNLQSFKIEVIFWDRGKMVKRKEDKTVYSINKVVSKMYSYYRWYHEKKNLQD